MMPSLSSLRQSRFPAYLGLFLIASIAAVLISNQINRGLLNSETSPQAGGATTLSLRSSQAFAMPAPGLNAAEAALHTEGDAAFDAIFVTAPASVNPGLGPLFNNSSCSACHIKNGRGLPQLGQALVRVSLPAASELAVNLADGVVPVPEIGTQIQDHAVYGYQPEAALALSWQEQTGQYADGTTYTLRSPQLKISPADSAQPLPDQLLTSLRIPPPVFGGGLLEAIPEQTLRAQADPEDRNQDGISGRLNRVWEFETQAMAAGRFGWKANSSTLLSQTATAYVNDMGVANPLIPDTEGGFEIDQETLEAATFYVQSLAVPARTQLEEPMVQAGEKLFAAANCTACHLSTVKTGPTAIAALADQTIHPYTDLLLHDMGTGLADGRPDFSASAQEWRTPPLWGIGLTQTVLPYSGYLHDGRARTLEEAILWHGGEAEPSKQQFVAMQPRDRTALLKFLNSL
ncbi:MAG: c-type cytochrome [Leptolyngbyaceae cyanobacterium RM1_1_2]|nr:c-type cytochrome [Leptolyngbyaceae cyanobacterium RM1_1_2]